MVFTFDNKLCGPVFSSALMVTLLAYFLLLVGEGVTFRETRGPFRLFRSFQKGQRAVEGTEGRRRDRGPWRGQRAVEGTEGCGGDRGP